MTKVLVAGATGYLGKYVAREFKRQGYWVRALCANPEKLQVEGPSLEPAIADIVDDVFVGQATRPATLAGLCDGIDVVFSSIGITRQKDKAGYLEVDYQANRNILDEALRTRVRKFIFIYGFQADLLQHLEPMRARRRFIDDLQQSGLDYTVVSPNGFFDDMSEFLRMAKRGTVYLIGDGTHRINPIHGADLAEVCAEAATCTEKEIPVGGPVIYSYREIAELACQVLDQPAKIRRLPIWLVKLAAMAIRPFSAKLYAVAAGMTTIMQQDFVAPQHGTHTLEDFYRQLAPRL